MFSESIPAASKIEANPIARRVRRAWMVCGVCSTLSTVNPVHGAMIARDECVANIECVVDQCAVGDQVAFKNPMNPMSATTACRNPLGSFDAASASNIFASRPIAELRSGVPIPSSVWLVISGLIGLVGVARPRYG